MHTWEPPDREWVQQHLEQEAATLHRAHHERFASLRIPMRQVPVRTHPGEFVWAVGEHEGKVLYWADVEEGWWLEQPDAGGGIDDRSASQLDLAQLMWEIFGDPDA